MKSGIGMVLIQIGLNGNHELSFTQNKNPLSNAADYYGITHLRTNRPHPLISAFL